MVQHAISSMMLTAQGPTNNFPMRDKLGPLSFGMKKSVKEISNCVVKKIEEIPLSAGGLLDNQTVKAATPTYKAPFKIMLLICEKPAKIKK